MKTKIRAVIKLIYYFPTSSHSGDKEAPESFFNVEEGSCASQNDSILFKLKVILLIAFMTPLSPMSHGLSVSGYEKKLFKMIVDYRIQHSLPRIKFDERLYFLAKEHSDEMRNKSKLSHDHFEERFQKSGTNFFVENVGVMDNQTPEKQLEGWKKSEKHNKNLLNPVIQFAAIAKTGDYVTFLGGRYSGEFQNKNILTKGNRGSNSF